MSGDRIELTQYQSKNVSEEDLKNLEGLLVDNPDDLQIIDWVAFANYTFGNLARAIELYRRCIDREPQTASYYYYLGNALYRQGGEADAVKAWEMAISQDRGGMYRKKAQERLDKLKA